MVTGFAALFLLTITDSFPGWDGRGEFLMGRSFPDRMKTADLLAGQKKIDKNSGSAKNVTKVFDELHTFSLFFTLISLLTCDIVKVETNENMEPSEAEAAGGFSMPWR